MEPKKASEYRDEMQAKILEAIRECEEQTGLRVAEIRYETFRSPLNLREMMRYELSVTYE